MADQSPLARFRELMAELAQLPTNESPESAAIYERALILSAYADQIAPEHLGIEALTRYRNALQAIATGWPDDDEDPSGWGMLAYQQAQHDFPYVVAGATQDLNRVWPMAFAAIMYHRGIDGVLAALQSTDAVRQQILDLSRDELRAFKERLDGLVQSAEKLANEKVAQARRTVIGFALDEAREQFKRATTSLRRQTYLWSAISLVLIAIVAAVVLWLMRIPLPPTWTWHIAYFTGIRVVLLSFIVGLVSYSLRILRAHIHMAQQNAHRQRVTDSMAAFLEAARTESQQDTVLSVLLSSVVTFGDSGLVDRASDTQKPSSGLLETVAKTTSSQR